MTFFNLKKPILWLNCQQIKENVPKLRTKPFIPLTSDVLHLPGANFGKIFERKARLQSRFVHEKGVFIDETFVWCEDREDLQPKDIKI